MFIGIPAAFLLCACGKQADTSATKTAPKVVYTKPVVRDIVLWDDYTAKIEAIASVNIRAQVGGYLKSINFKEGENVKKGDLLFVIDPRPYEAALASAEAELAEAKARVELAKTNLERAQKLNVPISAIFETMQFNLGSIYVKRLQYSKPRVQGKSTGRGKPA